MIQIVNFTHLKGMTKTQEIRGNYLLEPPFYKHISKLLHRLQFFLYAISLYVKSVQFEIPLPFFKCFDFL